MSSAYRGRLPAAWAAELSEDYEWIPLRLPADLDFAPMFHGIDERVPTESLEFGAKVLLRLIESC